MNLGTSEQQLSRFVRNMVSIVVVSAKTPTSRPFDNFSATVIWFRGSRWLVTAAHCARAIEAHYNGGTLIRWYSGDAWADQNGRGQLYWLPIEYANRWVILSSDDSYDVAMLDIGLNIASTLEAGKIDAIPEHDWMNPPTHFDFYALIGTPNEMVSHDGKIETGKDGTEHYWLPNGYDLQRGVFELVKTDRPAHWAAFSHARFYGKMVGTSDSPKVKTIKSIVGASGGPLFGCVKRGDEYTHHLLAIQSAWQADIKTVEADFLSLMPAMFDQEQQRKDHINP
jgi:hypothetical protein